MVLQLRTFLRSAINHQLFNHCEVLKDKAGIGLGSRHVGNAGIGVGNERDIDLAGSR